MIHKILFFLFVLLSVQALAQQQTPIILEAPSARATWDSGDQDGPSETRWSMDEGTVRQVATPLSEFYINHVPEWDPSALQQAFEYARDKRFLYSKSDPEFPRRISWLYPDDGCYARATLMSKNLEELGLPRPAKIYLFGSWASLRVRTPYAPGGTAWWGFHVAPIIKTAGKYYVLDPAVEPKRPLLLLEWVHRLTKNTAKLVVSICSPYTYNPNDQCTTEKRNVDHTAEVHQMPLLDLEWQRVKSIGRAPELELGDYPPWSESR